jgi:hypothetical protein
MIGELINCMARTPEARCFRCAVCRLEAVLDQQLMALNDELASIRRHQLEEIKDAIGEIADVAERL